MLDLNPYTALAGGHPKQKVKIHQYSIGDSDDDIYRNIQRSDARFLSEKHMIESLYCTGPFWKVFNMTSNNVLHRTTQFFSKAAAVETQRAAGGGCAGCMFFQFYQPCRPAPAVTSSEAGRHF